MSSHIANSVDIRFRQHASNPKNSGVGADFDASAKGVGSCGDQIQVDLKIRDGFIERVSCCPKGCLYTVACASAMSVLAEGRSIDDALALQPEDVERELGGLPEDHRHCARLAINTLGEAIAEFYRKHHADL